MPARAYRVSDYSLGGHKGFYQHYLCWGGDYCWSEPINFLRRMENEDIARVFDRSGVGWVGMVAVLASAALAGKHVREAKCP